MLDVAPVLPLYLPGTNNTGSTIGAYLAVILTATGITLPSAVTSPIYGFTTESVSDLARSDVQVGGVVAIGTANGAITKGTRLTVTTAGKVAAWAPASGVNSSVVGIALTTTTTDGDLIEILLGAGGIAQGA